MNKKTIFAENPNGSKNEKTNPKIILYMYALNILTA